MAMIAFLISDWYAEKEGKRRPPLIRESKSSLAHDVIPCAAYGAKAAQDLKYDDRDYPTIMASSWQRTFPFESQHA
jgi:hypothetical protein